jgi:hypothetical protein
MTGIGWTTIRGDQPRPFRVAVLGIMEDGIAPGRDLVIIRVSDLPGRRVIRTVGGIWSGMSGSPVYLNGRLAGAISYSLASGPSPIGGMTPARLMTPLADETDPTLGARRSGTARSTTLGRTVVRITGRLNQDIASATGGSAARTTVLRRLAVPIMASGTVGSRRSFLARELRRAFGSVRVVTTGGSSTSSTGAALAATPRPGANLAGVIARGDVTLAAVGTVTSVCRGVVLGFGHPMTGEGIVRYGAARASTVTIAGGQDPYKLANIGRTFGVLDRDRLVGVRATAGTPPGALPITARVRSLDTGRIRLGRTVVTTPAWMPVIAADHLLFDIQSVLDRYGGGTARLDWTIHGTRLDTDTTWSLHWTDRVADSADIAYAAALRLFDQLFALQDNPSAAIRIRSVSIDATVSRGGSAYAIRKVEVSANGGAWQSGSSVTIAPGDRLRVRVSLRPRTGRTTMRTLTLDVPGGVSGTGVLHAVGGADAPTDGCDLDHAACPTTFAGLLAALRAAPRGDDLRVILDLTGAGGDPVTVTRSIRLDRVVRGIREVALDAG